MAQTHSGGFTASTGFKRTDSVPLDDSQIYNLHSDLALVNKPYKLMMVGVLETNTYYVWNGDDVTTLSNWIPVGTGTTTGSSTNYTSSNNLVLSSLVLVDGTVQSHSNRVLTLGNLGYTGDVNANRITDNNQIDNSAGYITSYTNTQLSQTEVGDYALAEGFIKTDTNTQLSQSEVGSYAAAEGFIKTYTDTNTQLSQAQVGSYALAEGFIKTDTDTNTQLSDSDILGMGFIKTYTDTNTQLSDSDILGMGFIKTDTNTQLSQSEVGSYAAAEGFIKTYTDTNTQRTDEEIRSIAANQWANGTNTTVVYDDVGNIIKINAVDTVYTHPTGAGNKHIPSGGSTGQILKYESPGTAVWAADNNTVYTHPTTAGNKHIPSGGSPGQILKNTGSGTVTWADETIVNTGNFVTLTGPQTIAGIKNFTDDTGFGNASPSYKVDVTGTIRATGDIVAFSDIRVKENIATIDSALDKVSRLRGVEYNKIGEEFRSIGVIAQEIEKVIPEVVRTDDEGMKAVAYGNITGVLIEAIKELKTEIEQLKKQIK